MATCISSTNNIKHTIKLKDYGRDGKKHLLQCSER